MKSRGSRGRHMVASQGEAEGSRCVVRGEPSETPARWRRKADASRQRDKQMHGGVGVVGEGRLTRRRSAQQRSSASRGRTGRHREASRDSWMDPYHGILLERPSSFLLGRAWWLLRKGWAAWSAGQGAEPPAPPYLSAVAVLRRTSLWQREVGHDDPRGPQFLKRGLDQGCSPSSLSRGPGDGRWNPPPCRKAPLPGAASRPRERERRNARAASPRPPATGAAAASRQPPAASRRPPRSRVFFCGDGQRPCRPQRVPTQQPTKHPSTK